MKSVRRFGALACVAVAFSLGGAYGQPGNAAMLATPLEKSAMRYVEFRGDLRTIEETELNNAAAMRDVHMRLAFHDPEQLSAGWVAYAALVAADTPEFAASIQASINTPEKKNAFLHQLRMNPRSVRELPGSAVAISAVMDMAARDATRINGLGESFIEIAYNTQNVGWARKKLGEGMERVYEARDYASAREPIPAPILPAYVSAGVQLPSLAETAPDWQAGWAAEEEAVPTINPRATPIIDRVLVLAARYSVGDINEPIVQGYAKSDQSKRCLNMAKLNFDQCIAATRTPYEEAFCIGEHGLNDVSGCIGWVAGAGQSD